MHYKNIGRKAIKAIQWISELQLGEGQFLPLLTMTVISLMYRVNLL